MQSWIQYHRLGQRVQQQLDRDRHKSSAVRGYRHRGLRCASEQSTSFNRGAESDLEKGQEAKPQSQIPPHCHLADEKENVEGLDHHPTARKSSESAEEIEDEPQPQNQTLRPEPSLGLVSTRSVRSLGTRVGLSLTGINVRDRTTKEGGDRSQQVFVVEFEGPDDLENPHNWSRAKRAWATIVIAEIGFVVGFASSIDSSAIREAAEEFGVSKVVESMATGLFLIGFGVGALFAGPVSETVGRNPVYIATLTIYMIFIMAAGLSPNIGAQLVFRFLAGFFGSTPLTCAGGSLADIWSGMERVYAFPIFANAAFMGPVIGPVIGGFVAQSSLISWRWTEWVTLIMSGLVLVAVILTLPETFTPIILKWKAGHLRRFTQDIRYAGAIEVRAESFISRLGTSLYRPFLLTFSEPIVILVALYMTVIYIILFTFLDGYDYIYGEIHHTSEGVTGLCFLGIAIGLCVVSPIVPLIYSWAKKEIGTQTAKGIENPRLPPEFRLWYAMLGGSICIPVSLFWMGWTSDSSISIWSPLIASVFFGYGILCVFITSYQYVIDSYEIYAASALVSVTLLRYVACGGAVIYGVPMYENLGVHYTLTILACLSAALVPVPYLFYFYGEKVRSWSKYAVNAPSKT